MKKINSKIKFTHWQFCYLKNTGKKVGEILRLKLNLAKNTYLAYTIYLVKKQIKCWLLLNWNVTRGKSSVHSLNGINSDYEKFPLQLDMQ